MTQRTCIHPGCQRKHDANGYCSTHNSRIRAHGDAYGKRCETCRRPLEEVFSVVRTQRYCGEGCRPRCAFDGCGRAAAGAGLCISHRAQQRQGITLRPIRAWAASGLACLICGREAGAEIRSRVVCSKACGKLLYFHGGQRPHLIACAACASPIDLHEVGEGGRRRMANTKLCRDCKTVHVKYGMTVDELAERDGTACSICGDLVDMTLRRKDSVFCASIDHRTPRSRGGSDDPDNLALAHFWCNAVKSDREDFTI